MRIEIRQIVLQRRRRVALRIDGDEQRPGAVGVLAEAFQHLRNIEQRCRAHVGAMGKAEENQEWTSLHVFVAHRLGVLVLKLEGAADSGDRWPDRRWRAPGHDQDRAENEDEAAEKSAEHRYDAAWPFSAHCRSSLSRSTQQSRHGSSRRTPWRRSEPRARPSP